MPRFLPLILLLLTPLPSPGLDLSPEGAAALAVRRNPGLAAARWRIEEARGRLVQAGRPPNPELELGFSARPGEGENSVGATLTQRFPLTGRLRLERAVSTAQLSAAEWEVRDAARKLAAEARSAAVRARALGESRALRGEQAAAARELAGFVSRRVEVGELPRADATLAELDAAQAGLEITQAAAAEEAALATLRPLLGLPPGATLRITGSLAPPASTASSTRPDLLAAAAQSEAAIQAAALARAQRWDDLGVGFGVTRERERDDPIGLENKTALSARVVIPLPLWDDRRGRVREADAAARRAQQETTALRATIAGESAAAAAEAAGLARGVRQIDADLLPRARAAEDQARAAFAAGQLPFNEVLRVRARRFEIAQRRLDLLRDWHLAVVRLDAALGRGTPQQPVATPARRP